MRSCSHWECVGRYRIISPTKARRLGDAVPYDLAAVGGDDSGHRCQGDLLTKHRTPHFKDILLPNKAFVLPASDFWCERLTYVCV